MDKFIYIWLSVGIVFTFIGVKLVLKNEPDYLEKYRSKPIIIFLGTIFLIVLIPVVVPIGVVRNLFTKGLKNK